MDEVEWAYTRGMTDDEVSRRLQESETGVLALARGDDAYAVPVCHHFDGDRLYLRLGETEDSQKARYLESTGTACYVLYGTDETDDPAELTSWSVLATGRVVDLDQAERERFDAATINRHFAPVRLFDEAVEDVTVRVVAFETETLTGRVTTV